MILKSTIFLIAVLVLKEIYADVACTYNDGRETKYVGQWRHWEHWEGCSRDCGGGVEKRTRSICCAMDEEDCLGWHGKKWSEKFDYRRCNGFCYNGGKFEGNT